MASAEATVCNVALLRIGHLQTINSLADPTAAARACKTLWDFTRDALLQMRPWSFATARATLSAIEDGERSGFAFAYTLPPDFIAVRHLWSGLNNPDKNQVVPYRVEGTTEAGTTRVLLTDLDAAELVYTRKVVEVGRWDSMFRECMAMKLASDLAFGLAKRRELGLELQRAFLASLAAASASSANQDQPATPAVSEFETGRQ